MSTGAESVERERFKAGQLILSMGRVVRVLGPPENKPLWMYSDDAIYDDDPGPGELVDRLALPVESIPPPSDPPSAGEWIDESCFDFLQVFEVVPASSEGPTR